MTACQSEFEHRDAALGSGRTLLQRDTCCEAWLSTAEQRGGWEMNCDAGLAHGGRDRIQQLVLCSPPHPPPPPALSIATIKAGKGTWQVEGVEVMASTQRPGLELLKKRTVNQWALGERRQSCRRTVWVFLSYACMLKVSVHMQVNEVRLWNGNLRFIQTPFLTLLCFSIFIFSFFTKTIVS